MSAETAQRKGENGGEHDALAERTNHDGTHARHATNKDDERHGEDGTERTANQQLFRTDSLHEQKTADATAQEEAHATEREHQRSHSVGHIAFFNDIVDKETVDAGLGGDIEEQRAETEDKMTMTPKPAVRLIGGFNGRSGLHIGEFDKGEKNGDEQDGDADDGVGRGNVSLTAATGEEEQSADERTDNPSEPVERLREIDATLRILRTAEHGDVGVCRRFQTGQSAADDKEREKEKREGEEHAAGNEKQSTDAVETEAAEHTGTIAETTDDAPCGERHEEVATIEHHLNEG